MPCRCDHMEPTKRELESKIACEFIYHLGKKMKCGFPTWAKTGAENSYGDVDRADEATEYLCRTIRIMSKKDREKYVYDAHGPVARQLATWWEQHQVEDKARVVEENKVKVLLKKTVGSLTAEEKSLLKKYKHL